MDTTGHEPSSEAWEEIVREQIEILWRYAQKHPTLDTAFVHNHARMIVQLIDYRSSRGHGPLLESIPCFAEPDGKAGFRWSP